MTDVEPETPGLWPPHVKSWLIGKDPDAGRDWGQEEKGTTEDEMAGWHHRLDGHEFEWTPGVGDGQGGLACCDSWGHKESDTTERLNWTEAAEGNRLSMEMFFLSYVNETMYLLWNWPFFKMVPPKTIYFVFSNLGLILAQQTSIFINCFMAGGWHTCHPISKVHIMGEGPGETPSALKCRLSD